MTVPPTLDPEQKRGRSPRPAIQVEAPRNVDFECLVTDLSTRFVRVTSDTISKTVTDALQALGTMSGVDRVYIFLFHDQGRIIDYAYYWCAPGIIPQADRLHELSADSFPWLMEQLRRLETVHVPDVNVLPSEAASEKKEFQTGGVRSLACAPMFLGRELIGFLGFDSVRCEKHWSDGDLRLLKIVGEIIGGALVRVRSEKALQESAERFRNIIDSSAAGYFFADVDGRYRYVNDAWLAMHKYQSRDEILGCHYSVTLPEADAEKSRDHLRKILEQGRIQSSEFIRVCKDGSIGYHLFSANTVIKGGEVVGMEGFLIDITDRKKAEEELKASQEKFRRIAELAPEAIFEVDDKGYLTFANRKAFETFGYSLKDTYEGLSIFDMLAPEDRETASGKFAQLLAGLEQGPGEYTAIRKNGARFPIAVHSEPIIRNGRVIGFLGVIIDLTDAKRREEERLVTRKLESIGVLAGGLAHDFNNILTAILGNISLAARDLDPESELYGLLNDAEEASIKARRLTKKLLTFSEGGMPVKKIASIGQIVTDAVSLSVTRPDIDCRFSMAHDLSRTEIDQEQISQVIKSVVRNAEEAMPQGGTITICLDDNLVGVTGVSILPPGRYVRIAITDTGEGIPPEHIGRIFDPFFTTRGKAHGLGLAIAYSIIKKHNGAIEVTSTPGLGTTVTINLPVTLPDSFTDRERGLFIKPRGGRILVMDDEAIVRNLAGKVLERLGYDVECVADGNEAIRHYRDAKSENRPFDAVIMDLVIPGGRGGMETIRELRAIDPDVKAIVTTGYSNDPVILEYAAYGFCGCIIKPFRADQLATVLIKILTPPPVPAKKSSLPS